MADNIDSQTTIKIIYPNIKDRNTIAAIGKVRIDLTYASV